MSGNLTALQTVWATFPATMTTSDKLSLLNSKIVPGPPKDVRRSEIKKILSASGALPTMAAYVASPVGATSHDCLVATNYLFALITYEATLGDILATSDVTNLNTIEGMVQNLLLEAANGMTQPVIDAVMALITPGVPWWQANGFTGPVLVSDLIAAGSLI